jgi:hypothetical protein
MRHGGDSEPRHRGTQRERIAHWTGHAMDHMRTRVANPLFRGTGCGKPARPGLWGSRRVTGGSTRKFIIAV